MFIINDKIIFEESTPSGTIRLGNDKNLKRISDMTPINKFNTLRIFLNLFKNHKQFFMFRWFFTFFIFWGCAFANDEKKSLWTPEYGRMIQKEALIILKKLKPSLEIDNLRASVTYPLDYADGPVVFQASIGDWDNFDKLGNEYTSYHLKYTRSPSGKIIVNSAFQY